MKFLPWALLAVAIAAAGLYVTYVHDPMVRRAAHVEDARDSLNREVTRLYDAAKVTAKRDKKLSDSVGVLLRLSSATGYRVDTLQVDADSIAVQLLAAMADSLRPRIRAALAAKDTVIYALLYQRDQMGGIFELQRRQIALRDTTIAGMREALTEAISQREQYRKLAHPSLRVRVLRDLPKLALGGLIGYVLAH
jgi:hypothetical protein